MLVPHQRPSRLTPPKGRIVHCADHIAYINHDIDDAIRAGVLHQERSAPGRDPGCWGRPTPGASPPWWRPCSAGGRTDRGSGSMAGPETDQPPMLELRGFHVPAGVLEPGAPKGRNTKCRGIIAAALRAISWSTPTDLPRTTCRKSPWRRAPTRAACDYVAGMTDRFAVDTFTQRCSFPRRLGLEH